MVYLQLLFNKSGNGNMRPIDIQKVKDNHLGILQLQKDLSIRELNFFYPECCIHSSSVGIYLNKWDIHNSPLILRGDLENDGIDDILSYNGIPQQNIGIVNTDWWYSRRNGCVR